MIPAARIALQNIRDHWEDLETALGAPNTSCWPPAGLRHHLAQQARRDVLAERTALRALERDPRQIGESQAPISLDVVDTMAAVTAQLVELADHIASRVQRPSMSRAPREWHSRDRALRNQAAARDAADRRRWRYVGTRTAVDAATWLDARLVGAPGPFRPMTGLLHERIAHVATHAAVDVLRALELTRQARRLDMPCPHCRATALDVQGGDGTPPSVYCRACGRVWREVIPA